MEIFHLGLSFALALYQSGLIYFVFLASITSALVSCGPFKPKKVDLRKIPGDPKDKRLRNIKEGRGFTVMGAIKKRGGSGAFDFATSNEMWRASLELLDFTPLHNVDYSGGIITTDWYNEGTSLDESIKITIRFLTNEIRSDGLKIIVHKKRCSVTQICSVKKITTALEQELRVAILKKAVLYDKEDNSKKKKKKFKRNIQN